MERKTAPGTVEERASISGKVEQGEPATIKCEGIEGEIDSAEHVHYESMSWIHAAFVLIAETISLGILSLPRALSSVGLVPGVLLILGLGLLTTYTGYVMYELKIMRPEIDSFADAMALVMGKPGRWIGEVLQALLLIFIMAAHVLTFSVMMNTLTEHALCTIAFTVIGAVVSFFVTLPRTLKCNAKFSYFSCASIACATIIAMIGIGISRPGIHSHYAFTPAALTSLQEGSMAVSNMIIAYNGHIAYPTIISEMRNPRDFPKALAMLQTTTITFYLVVAVVIYYYAGQDVGSPALSSATPIVRKIAFGIACPTIIVAGVIAALVAAKTLYKHLWAHNPVVQREKTLRARGSWVLIVAALWIVAWAIASAIPVFKQLLALIGAAFGTWFCVGFLSMFWFWMNWRGSLKESYARSWKTMALCALNVTLFVMGAVICVLGMYGSIAAIASNESKTAPFSCADNAS